MKAEKILYVDDEAIALKYFERLVGPLAPVLTAISVEEGRAVLSVHGQDIAVLVCDQRMPGERGNELLNHARQHYPHIVRMLTTAYSEIGEAIDAINTGEIYRYIAKPWELESLRAELKNALELSGLRQERDELMRDKLLAHQSQLMSTRLGALAAAVAGLGGDHERALFRCAQTVLRVSAPHPGVDWRRWDHAELQAAQALRGAEVAAGLRQWLGQWGPYSDDHQALKELGLALGVAPTQDALVLGDARPLSAVLSAAAGASVSAQDCAWPAWQLWTEGRYEATPVDQGWRVALAEPGTLPSDWLVDAMERFGRPAG